MQSDLMQIYLKRHHPFRIVEKVCKLDQKNLHTFVLERVTPNAIGSFALFGTEFSAIAFITSS